MRPDTKVFFATALILLGIATVTYIYVPHPTPPPTSAPSGPPTTPATQPPTTPATQPPTTPATKTPTTPATPPPTPYPTHAATVPPPPPVPYPPTIAPIANGAWLFHGNQNLQYTMINTTSYYNNTMTNSIHSLCGYYTPNNGDETQVPTNYVGGALRCGAGIKLYGPSWPFFNPASQITLDQECASNNNVPYDNADTSYFVDCYTNLPNFVTSKQMGTLDSSRIYDVCNLLANRPSGIGIPVSVYCYLNPTTGTCRAVFCEGNKWEDTTMSYPVAPPTLQKVMNFASNGLAYMFQKVKLP